MNENNLIARINKNPEVFSEVIEAYQDKLLRYIMRISNISYEEAENLLQEIFIRVYRYINEYDSRYSFSSWIYRIAHNLTIDSYRKNKKEMENISIDDEEYASVVQSLSDGNSPQIDLHKKEIKACVQKAISLLSSEYREAIVLRCIE